MSVTKLKINQYQDLLTKLFGDRLEREAELILTYLFYKVKVSDDLDDFKNIDDADIRNYFKDVEFRRCYESAAKNINQDVLLFSSIIKNTEAEVLKEFLNACIKRRQYYINRKIEKASIEDLIVKILDIEEGQDFLYCYESSLELLNELLERENIKATVYCPNAHDRYGNNYNLDYVYLKINLELNSHKTELIYGDKVEGKFDKIYIDPSSMPKQNNSDLAKIIRQNLKSDGTAVRLMQDFLLDTIDEDIKNEREKDLNENILKSVIVIPKDINAYSSNILTNSSIVIYSKERSYNNCMFVDASNECESNDRFSYFTEENMSNILKATIDESCSTNELISYDLIRDKNCSFLPFDYIKYDGKLMDAIELEKVAKVFRGNDLVRIRKGINELQKLSGQYEYRSLAATNIDDENIDYHSLPIVRLDKNIDGFVIKVGDILINKNGTRLRTCLYDCKEISDVVPDGNIIVIRPDSTKVNPIYLKIYLDSDEGNKALLNIAQSGTLIRSINVGRLNRLSIPCPMKERQDEFAKKYLEKMDKINKMNKEIAVLCSDYFHKS